MIKEKMLIQSTDDEIACYKKYIEGSSVLKEKNEIGKKSITYFNSFLPDVYFSFYLEKPEIKKIEDVPCDLWQNYYLLEGLLEHYQYKNIHSLVEKQHQDAFWITEIFINELLKIITEKKKTVEMINDFTEFLLELKEKGLDYTKVIEKAPANASKEEISQNKKTKERVLDLKKEIKFLISKTMVEVNKILNKLQPVMILTRGHNLSPIPALQIPYESRNAFAEKTGNLKLKEILKIYSQLDLHVKPESKGNSKKTWEEKLAESVPQEVIYLDNTDNEQKEKVKKWLQQELNEYNPEEKSGPITAYIKAGNVESKNEVLESFAIALGILEVSRLQKRNFIAVVSGLESGEKTYMFGNNGVSIQDSNSTKELAALDGTISFLNELLSGPKPPKQKFSLNLNIKLKSDAPARRKKIFKKSPTMIKFEA